MDKIRIYGMEGEADILSEDSDSVYYQFPNGRRRSVGRRDLGITWSYVEHKDPEAVAVEEVEETVSEPVKPLDIFHENPETDEGVESMIESDDSEVDESDDADEVEEDVDDSEQEQV